MGGGRPKKTVVKVPTKSFDRSPGRGLDYFDSLLSNLDKAKSERTAINPANVRSAPRRSPGKGPDDYFAIDDFNSLLSNLDKAKAERTAINPANVRSAPNRSPGRGLDYFDSLRSDLDKAKAARSAKM